MTLKISVITPTLNSEKHIERAIQSVLEQNYNNVEHIIIDGRSEDKTIDIIMQYPHLKWVSEKDNGQSEAMNKGFRISGGDIIVYLNSDDYFLPNAFKSVLGHLESGEKFVVGRVKVVMSNGESFINDPRISHLDILRHWEPNAFPNNPLGYFYYRQVQEEIGGFNENNYLTMDVEFLTAASQKFKFKKIDALLGVYTYLDGTKTVQAQKDPSYWRPGTFSFVDRYLEVLPREYVYQYRQDQISAYSEKRRQLAKQQGAISAAKEAIKSKMERLSMKLKRYFFSRKAYW